MDQCEYLQGAETEIAGCDPYNGAVSNYLDPNLSEDDYFSIYSDVPYGECLSSWTADGICGMYSTGCAI